MVVVVLDSCVLVPSLQRDVILSLAGEGLLTPVWSDRILAEVERTIRRLRRARGVPLRVVDEYLAHLFGEMARVFPDSCVGGWGSLEGTFGLPDPDDEHVVALAVVARAGAIVTENLKDFSRERLPGALHAVRPRDFALHTIAASPRRAVAAMTALASRRRLDPLALCELLSTQGGMPDAAHALKSALLRAQGR